MKTNLKKENLETTALPFLVLVLTKTGSAAGAPASVLSLGGWALPLGRLYPLPVWRPIHLEVYTHGSVFQGADSGCRSTEGYSKDADSQGQGHTLSLSGGGARTPALANSLRELWKTK